jgi:hypothetical protein
MKCNLCEENYDPKYRIPRNLTCGHCFCEQCLKIYCKNEEIECPKCAKKSPSKLPICYAIYELIDGEDQLKKSDYCTLHPLEKLQFLCKNENVNICVNCLISHHNGHIVSSLKENSIANEIKRDYENLYSSLQNKHTFLKYFKSEIDKCEDFITKMCDNQKIKINEIHNNFINRKKEKLEEFNKTIEINYLNQHEILSKIISEVEFKKNYIEIYSNKIQELLDSFSKDNYINKY